MANVVETPLMKQYLEFKAMHPDAILLFRVGDFYETFLQDAVMASEILGITLTKRANGAAQSVELAGFPHHALDTYLPKLVRAGKRVAICDQLEDPKLTKKLVKRGITELVTPGVAVNDNILDHKENNFLAAVHFEKKMAGVAFLDISTGEFLTAQGTCEYVDKLLNGIMPKEVLFERTKRAEFEENFGSRFFTYELEDWIFTSEAAHDRLLKHFETKNLKGFGVENLKLGIVASGAILHYLDMTQHTQISHITHLSRIEEDKYVWLDQFTIRNLELYGTMHEGGKTLVNIIDRTITPMGARLLKRWVAFPLKDVKPIEERLNIVDEFFRSPDLKESLDVNMSVIGDLERVISKVAVGRVTPREVVQLKVALGAILPIKEACLASDNDGLRRIGEQLNPCPNIREKIERTITMDPPNMLNRGGVIANGVSAELDDLRNISHSGKDYLLQLQQRESERTGIPSLKVSYNNVFGYYIEVRNTHKDKVPEDWIRKQTLTAAERYITQELKEYEEKILGAEEKILSLETQIFNELVLELTEYIPAIQVNSNLVAKLDVLMSFAKTSEENHYVRPAVNDSDVIDIKQGRHPVIERQLPIGEQYVANDLTLDSQSQQIIMITGPNMAGKSALLRQTALIVLMAQIGCFVPADAASIGVVDKIFTRVGASDNISMGESTFMVEMNEAASIINNLSQKSLVLFDELGRGTSTYDGISIAWSIVEYIHEHPKAKAKTLFATHYHELNEMEKLFPRIKNYNVSVKEVDGKVIFLRKLVRGSSEHSFGIHVAKLAGLPNKVVNRANEILEQLEVGNSKNPITDGSKPAKKKPEAVQLSLFQLDDPILEAVRDEINHLDINNLTPIEALNKLNEIKKIVGGK
ncbi:MAG: DNA mismatch repair protein MutS [Paludibacteraceae bacterium]|nr:DNA mismatch repair protein MutS [Paludibacteraceae bacterium]MBR4712535.1 DNA mismatch repair protein MutS [Paludibacteraceae bacterium]